VPAWLGFWTQFSSLASSQHAWKPAAKYKRYSLTGPKVKNKPLSMPTMHILLVMVVLACSRVYGFGSADSFLLFLGNHSLPPMIFMDNGKPAGVVVDLAGALARRMTRPVKFEYMNWATAQQRVLEGRADALIQINPTEERKKLYDFSESLLESEFSIFIRFDKERVYSIRDLQGLKVGVEEKGMPISLLNRNPSISLAVIPDVVQGMHLLADGAIDAVVVDRWVGSFVLAENHIRGIRITGEAIDKSSSAIAVKKGNAALLAEINKALAAIKADGSYAKILSKWQPQEVIFQTKAQYIQQKGILLTILCMFVLALIWSIFLLREIKKRKKAEESMQESEARTAAILDSITDRFFSFDKDWRFTRLNRWSRQQLRQLGKDPNAMIGLRLWDEFPGLPVEEVFCRAMEERIAITHESYNARTGEWLEDRVYPTPDGGLAVFQADITGRKRAEEALRANEERLRLAIDAARLATWDWDIPSGEVVWNEHHYRVLGYEPGAIQPTYKAWADRVHPDDRVATEASLRHAMEQGGDYVYHFRTLWPDGTVRFLSALGRFERDAEGRAVRNYGAMLDGTEHKRAESILLELTQRLTYHVDNSPLAVIEWGPDMRMVRWSGAAEPIFGWKAEEVLGKRMEDFRWIYEEDQSQVAEVSRELTTGMDLHRFSANRNYRKDGSVVYCEWYNSSLVDESGKLRSILSLVLDVTKRKQAEEALRERERLLQTVIDGSTSPIFLKDLDGKFITINASLERMLGISRAEIKGKTDYDIARREVADYWSTHDKQVMAACKAIQFEEAADLQDGHHIFLANKFPLVDVDGQAYGVASISHDITERKRVEEELNILNKTLEDRITERTAEAEQRALQLRQLAAELTLAEQRERQRISLVLHDGLQQILVAAKFQIALIEKTKDVQRLTSELAGLIDDGIETSRSLTAELSPPILQQGGLVPALEWLVNWMRDKHGLTVSLASHGNIESAPEAVVILLFQSVRELLFNVAKHAGIRMARVEVMQEAGRIRVDVEDDGAGFDPVQLNGEGAKSRGMGLFSIQERLSYLGGSMEIDSAPGSGSRFTLITPPISMKTAVSPVAKQSIVSISMTSQLKAKVGSEKRIGVILVDDHMVMRQGLAGLLRAEPDIEILGEASDGQSAIELTRELRPDVVLMDISMPGMDGIQATRIIHKELPEVRIIGLSMFREGERDAAMREAGAVDYLTKTGPSEALISAIRACVRVSEKSLAD
jgi:PAS domain S-box-containing protein